MVKLFAESFEERRLFRWKAAPKNFFHFQAVLYGTSWTRAEELASCPTCVRQIFAMPPGFHDRCRGMNRVMPR
ncbi:hypothetical protein NJLHNGOC_14595 [Novacetimonas cocois]|uniref:Uncharacterized protein n=1 Tax=Novacetimonas cocois TaxID=1747507 RepID=A0A365YRV4_9PROT|nr:hypothetical protein NJLHNGOC_14595 [Novacetimonas cocois]